MKNFILIAAFIFSSLAIAGDGKVSFLVALSPAGSFTAVSNKAKGNLFKTGDTFTADKISVSIESFKTGIDLRDEHTWKHMNSKKNPKAVLTDLKAQGGKATANLELNAVKKPINIAYSVKGEVVNATFSVKASDFAYPKAEYLGVGVNDLIKVEVEMPFKVK